MNQKELLAHADFIHSLARRLVADEHRASDLEQETWLAALRKPPGVATSLRAWLSKVMRNFARMTHRNEKSRMDRERRASDAAGIPTPEENAISREILRRMTEAVIGLKEPYYTAVLLRFYHDLSAREIAARQNVPVETVKTRIQRGLNMLRLKLDAEYGGSRRKWCLALAPLAGFQFTAAAAGSATLLSGAFVMTTKAKVAIAVLFLIGTSYLMWKLLPEYGEEKPSQEGKASSTELTQDEGEAPAGREEATPESGLVEEEQEQALVEPSATVLSGRVTDRKTGAPVKAFSIRRHNRDDKTDAVDDETVRNKEGRFHFLLEEGGVFDLTLRSSRYMERKLEELVVPEGAGLTGLEIQMDPGFTVSGRVVDDATGRPVKGAIVGPARRDLQTDLEALLINKRDQSCIHAISDGKGRFELQGLGKRDERIAAAHPEYAEGFVETSPGSNEEVEIRLKRGYCLFGTAFDDAGRPAPDIRIRVRGKGLPICRPVLTSLDGSYRTGPVVPGLVFAQAGERSGGAGTFTKEYKAVEIKDRDVRVDFGFDRGHVTWRGVFFGPDGAPEKKGMIIVTSTEYSHDQISDYDLRQRVLTDPEGRFELGKLSPGCYQVNLKTTDGTVLEWENIVFDHPGVTEKDIVLEQKAVISGVVVNRITGEPLTGRDGHVWMEEDVQARGRHYSSRIGPEGRFRIWGVEPGDYMLDVSAAGLPPKFFFGIKVKKGEQKDDLRLAVDPGGKVRIRAFGFSPREPWEFGMAYVSGERERTFNYGTPPFRMDGTLDFTLTQMTGRWVASFAFKNLGYIEREYEIFPGAVTDVLVQRHEVIAHEGVLALSGSLSHHDGTPAAGNLMRFFGIHVPGLSDEESAFQVMTDKDGRFHLSGFKPGTWRVSALLASRNEVIFPRMRIPMIAAGIPPLHLVIPGTSVLGALYDSRTGDPFIPGRPQFWGAHVHNVETDEYVVYLSGKGKGNRISIEGVPPGNFELLVDAEGYARLKSKVFTLDEYETVDLGKLFMDPCGALHLEVVDPNDDPVKTFSVYLNEEKLETRSYYPPGQQIFEGLDPGPAKITVKAKGFAVEEIETLLKPGEPCNLKIVLHAE